MFGVKYSLLLYSHEVELPATEGIIESRHTHAIKIGSTCTQVMYFAMYLFSLMLTCYVKRGFTIYNDVNFIVVPYYADQKILNIYCPKFGLPLRVAVFVTVSSENVFLLEWEYFRSPPRLQLVETPHRLWLLLAARARTRHGSCYWGSRRRNGTECSNANWAIMTTSRV